MARSTIVSTTHTACPVAARTWEEQGYDRRSSRACCEPSVPVTLDLYRDIHKGIRAELFARDGGGRRPRPGRPRRPRRPRRATCTTVARSARRACRARGRGRSSPRSRRTCPVLAERIATDHAGARGAHRRSAVAGRRRGRSARLARARRPCTACTSSWRRSRARTSRTRTSRSASSCPRSSRPSASSRSSRSTGDHRLASRPRRWRSRCAVMLPAMNIDDRAEMLGGMQQGAPAEVFGRCGASPAPCSRRPTATRWAGVSASLDRRSGGRHPRGELSLPGGGRDE